MVYSTSGNIFVDKKFCAFRDSGLSGLVFILTLLFLFSLFKSTYTKVLELLQDLVSEYKTEINMNNKLEISIIQA